MRGINVKLWGCIGLIWVAVMIIGCGGGDLLDEPEHRYTASIAIQDGEEETLTIDTVQSFCDTEPEDFFDATASVTVTVASGAPGITLKGYTLEYIPLESEDGTGTIVMPPDLDGPLHGGNLMVDIASGTTSTFEITCLSIDTKEEFRVKVGWLYYTDTPGGQAAIAAKETEVDNKQVEVDAKEQEIADALAADPTADTSGLEIQLESLNTQLANLQADLAELYYSFWSVPELQSARYKIRITFNFEDTEHQDRTIVREATVWLGAYNKC